MTARTTATKKTQTRLELKEELEFAQADLRTEQRDHAETERQAHALQKRVDDLAADYAKLAQENINREAKEKAAAEVALLKQIRQGSVPISFLTKHIEASYEVDHSYAVSITRLTLRLKDFDEADRVLLASILAHAGSNESRIA